MVNSNQRIDTFIATLSSGKTLTSSRVSPENAIMFQRDDIAAFISRPIVSRVHSTHYLFFRCSTHFNVYYYFMQINVLPRTYTCVHVCAILKKPEVGVRSSGTTYRWMVVNCHVDAGN